MEWIKQAIAAAREAGAGYADGHYQTTRYRIVKQHNGDAQPPHDVERIGFKLRVIVNGVWGEISTSNASPRVIYPLARRVVDVAKSRAVLTTQANANPPNISDVEGTWSNPIVEDPFARSSKQIKAFLNAPYDTIRRERGLHSALMEVHTTRRAETFVSSQNVDISQTWTHCGAQLRVRFKANDGSLSQRSTGPYFSAGGWEVLNRMPWVKVARQLAKEAATLTTAPLSLKGRFTVVIGAQPMAVLVHETIGHALEADLVLAGQSPWTIGSWQNASLGSDIIHVDADPTVPNGLANHGFDMLGKPAQRQPLVEAGRVVNLITTPLQADTLKLGQSVGHTWAGSVHRPSVLRMSNINLRPGDATLDSMVQQARSGLFLEGVRRWEIDAERRRLTLFIERARAIVDGRLGFAYQRPILTVDPTRLWHQCKALANDTHAVLGSMPLCRKGSPAQQHAVSHRVVPGLFEDMQVEPG